MFDELIPINNRPTNLCTIEGCVDFGKVLPENVLHTHVLKETQNKAAGSEGSNSYRIPIPFRFDLIPPIFLRELSEIYEEGAVKYGDAKYIESPLPASVVVNHLMNHLLLWISGDRSEKHLGKVAWGIATLMVLEDLANNALIESTNDLSQYGSRVQAALQKYKDSL